MPLTGNLDDDLNTRLRIALVAEEGEAGDEDLTTLVARWLYTDLAGGGDMMNRLADMLADATSAP